MKHRYSLGIVKYPHAVPSYLLLERSVLPGPGIQEEENIWKFNRRWYEYLWQRNPQTGAGTRAEDFIAHADSAGGRFVVDDIGYLSDHACLMIQPTAKTQRAWEDFEERMNAVAGRTLTEKELLQCCLAHESHRSVRGSSPGTSNP